MKRLDFGVISCLPTPSLSEAKGRVSSGLVRSHQIENHRAETRPFAALRIGVEGERGVE